MKRIFLLWFIIVMTIPVMAQSPSESTSVPMSRKDTLMLGYLMRISQHTAPAYKLYPTENIWTFLELETFTGKIWQVQYSVSGDRFKVPVNSVDLSFDFTGDLQYAGRFELYSTKNMYNFLLLDRENGQVWQIQWSTDPDNRGLVGAINTIE
jgi:hypothetical protein